MTLPSCCLTAYYLEGRVCTQLAPFIGKLPEGLGGRDTDYGRLLQQLALGCSMVDLKELAWFHNPGEEFSQGNQKSGSNQWISREGMGRISFLHGLGSRQLWMDVTNEVITALITENAASYCVLWNLFSDMLFSLVGSSLNEHWYQDAMKFPLFCFSACLWLYFYSSFWFWNCICWI